MAQPLVGIIMGSSSDWETMRHAAETLDKLGVAHETKVVSAHRTPKRLYDYAHSAKQRGLWPLRSTLCRAWQTCHLRLKTEPLLSKMPESRPNTTVAWRRES